MSVKPIDRRVVHQICSGQVVLNLATAVKELIENSLDAGATVIEIKLREYGSEQIEVIDNASGIEESNFAGLTLKHHTSKLREFCDLTSVDTFGFRGEALSSLCALSDLVITTCHKSASIGTRITYDHNGDIRSKSACPRQQGTTTILQNLFYTLPVRHKEFMRNIKKEFTKMVQLLQAYCIISVGVKINCTNQTSNGKKIPIIMTHGNTSTKENIINMFGPKQLQSVLELKQVSPDEEISEQYGLKPEQSKCSIFRITGYISKPDHGQGRSSTDRQFFFINKRPCDFQKVTKVVNEMYHMYNRNQFPFLVLDVSLAKDMTDVNLTPDKRMILVQEEKTLLAIIKTSLKQMFAPRAAMYDINQQASVSPGNLGALFGRGAQKSEMSPMTQQGPGSKLTLAGLKRSFSATGILEYDSSTREAKQPKLDAFFRRSKSEMDSSSSSSPSISSASSSSQSFSVPQDSNSQTLSSQDSKEESPADSLYYSASECSQVPRRCNVKASNSPPLHSVDVPTKETKTQVESAASEKLLDNTIVPAKRKRGRIHEGQELMEEITGGGPAGAVETEEIQASNTTSIEVVNLTGNISKEVIEESDQVVPTYKTDNAEEMLFTKKEVMVSFSIAGIKNRRKQHQDDTECLSKPDFLQNFRAKIKPSDNTAAEDELKKVFSKTSFREMEVIGQFNLGFIITKLKSDLFIVDQHATDEKYNFEDLQKNTVLQSQRLIQPMKLELTAVNEMILRDNLDIFRKNGFEFSFNEEAQLMERVKLTSAPVSKNWTFGREDIDEMIFMLSDAPGTMCRPSRIRQMFASRSCRKSVMIGTALNKSEMTKLVSHMADLEQPWNCPHGRPTFRHLFNLNMLPD